MPEWTILLFQQPMVLRYYDVSMRVIIMKYYWLLKLSAPLYSILVHNGLNTARQAFVTCTALVQMKKRVSTLFIEIREHRLMGLYQLTTVLH